MDQTLFSKLAQYPMHTSLSGRSRVVSPVDPEFIRKIDDDRISMRNGGYVSRRYSFPPTSSPSPPISDEDIQTLIKSDPREYQKSLEHYVQQNFVSLVHTLSNAPRRGTWETDRAGIPFLLPLPLEPAAMNSDLERFLSLRFRKTVENILADNGVEVLNFGFTGRSYIEEMVNTTDDTIFIVAKKPSYRTNPNWYIAPLNWIQAACDIYETLCALALRPELLKLPPGETRILQSMLPSIKVEIVAPNLYENLHLEPLLPNDPFTQAWNKHVKYTIKETLNNDTTLRGRWNTLKVLRCGQITTTAFEEDSTVTTITIFVTVDENLNELDWIFAKMAIERLCDDHDRHDIAIEFSRGYNEELKHRIKNRIFRPALDISRSLRDLEFYPLAVNMGAEFGAAKDHWSPQKLDTVGDLGTVGGYIVLQFKPGVKKDGYNFTRRVFALTNYHTTRPAFDGFQIDAKGSSLHPKPRSTLDKIDKLGHGPGLKNMQSIASILESPSRLKHDITISHHQSEIQRVQDTLGSVSSLTPVARQTLSDSLAEDQRNLQAKMTFFDNGEQKYARPFLGSGLTRRTIDGARQDWALMEVIPDRIGENLIPPKSDWPKTGPAPLLTGHLIRESRSLLPDLNNQNPPSSTEWLYMVGARTGNSIGQFNPTTASVGPSSRMVNLGVRLNDHTEELSILTAPQFALPRFSDHGDSGAWIFDQSGELVGLHWGGNSDNNLTGHVDGRLTWFTDIKSVFAAIADIVCDEGTSKISKDDLMIEIMPP